MPKFTRGEVDRAAAFLFRSMGPLGARTSLNDARAAVNNWRVSHAFPMHVIKNMLQRRAQSADRTAVVVHRLKRIGSIKAKLRHPENPNMQLTQMQDIGGCRAIMPLMEHVDQLVDLYRRRLVPVKKDYIAKPKPDGYRSIHLIEKYGKPPNVRRIEIQIRTLLQHEWATAVETASTFTGEALRSNVGHAQWRRFFSLASSLIAVFENSPRVPGTPIEYSDLHFELSGIMDTLRVIEVFTTWGSALKQVDERISTARKKPRAHLFLIILNSKSLIFDARPFTLEETEQAHKEYFELEKDTEGMPELQTVLVSADSVEMLKKAYPNYYLDTLIFANTIKELLKHGPNGPQ